MVSRQELADRCEKASGPDRELDAMIAVAIDFHAADSNPSSVRSLHRDYGGNNDFADIGKYWPRLLPYTGSIDAAMQLVPEGWHVVELGELPDENDRQHRAYSGEWGVRLHLSANRMHNLQYGTAATPALALCAAALRAQPEDKR